jgi:hypothetical protein
MNGAPAAQNAPMRKEQPAQANRLRTLAELLVVVVCTLSFVFTVMGIGAGVLGTGAPGTRDFVEYWASGQQLTHHANPYDGSALLPMERAVGLPSGIPPMVMGNAPPALLLVYPLGFLHSRTGEILWSLLLLACLIASVRMIRAIHGAPNNKLHFLAYGFGPALVCLAANQAAMFVLLGLALFLRFYRSRPFLAGAALWFCALKPQLFLPFGLALLAWIITARRYRLLAGAVSALLFSIGAAYVLDPSAWAQYHRMMSASRYDKLSIPCLSIVLRQSISPNTMWLQYVPAAIGCIWALAYFWKHRRAWDWLAHGSLLMLVSVLVAPYTWIVDQAVLMPALLHGIYVTRSRRLLAILAMTSAVLEIAPLRGKALMHSAFYLWTVPTWLAWYLLATRSARRESAGAPPVTVEGVTAVIEAAGS